MSRRLYDRREGRKSSRFIDRTGMIAHRLLYLEWLGKWKKQHYWKALCECGTTCEVQWRIGEIRSCGCLKRETDKRRSFETQRPDGRWGLKTEARLRMDDGTIVTIRQLAEQAGVHKRVMAKRVALWPQHRWLEPPHATGLRPAKIVKTSWHRRPQPWAAATTRMLNAEGLAYRKTKPASASPLAAGPGQAAAACPGPADDHRHAQEGSAPDAAAGYRER